MTAPESNSDDGSAAEVESVGPGEAGAPPRPPPPLRGEVAPASLGPALS